MSTPLVYRLNDNVCEKIEAIDFSLGSNAEIERLGVSKLTLLNDEKKKGLQDEMLGVFERRQLCRTCGQDCQKCPGHTGAMFFPVPVYHMGYIETVLKILRSVCFFCARLRQAPPPGEEVLSYSNHSQFAKKKFARVYGSCRTRKTCIHCNGPCPDYIRAGNGIDIIWSPKTQFASVEEEKFAKSFNIFTVDNILLCIPDEDLRLMGFNPEMSHPKDTILWLLLIPSPAIRPSVVTSEGSKKRGQDDITVKLQDINKKRTDVIEYLKTSTWKREGQGYSSDVPAMPSALEQLVDRLQVEVALYMNNSQKLKKASTTARVTANMKSIMCKLKGKDGRIRGNLMGKRVNFCARTVITPDASIDINELGVPVDIALQLTIPERVTHLNIKRLTECVRRGTNLVGGASTIITKDAKVYELAYAKDRENIHLEYGWVVERTLNDGDFVFFNRQPSLHKQSIMGHRVKVMKGLTFRLNLTCAAPYNADFDGDEMNLHVPQNPMTMAEAQTLVNVDRCILSAKANKPAIGIVQDSLLGSYLMTHLDALLTRPQVMHLLASVKHCIYPRATWNSSMLPPPALLAPYRLWTGRQVIDAILPPICIGGNKNSPENTTLQDLQSQFDSDIPYIREEGLLNGTMTKSLLGPVAGGIIHRCALDFEDETAVFFISDLQRITRKWLMNYGFGVGIGDCIVNDQCDAEMRLNIDQALQHVNSIALEIPQDAPGVSKSLVEKTITSITSKVTMQVGAHIKRIMNTKNALMAMINAGSKGNPINLSQIMGCVGQQCVNGERITKDPATGRVLSCYPCNDDSVNGRGFVTNSYTLGLEPDEYFLHAMGGREGLVDTAVKTAVTGYLQRRMIKAGESMRVAFDTSVRDANNNIVEFKFGSDGMDATLLEKVEIPELCFSDAKLHAHCHPGSLYSMHPSCLPDCWEKNHTLEKEYLRLLEIRDKVRQMRELGFTMKMSTLGHFPVNVSNLLLKISNRQNRRSLTNISCTHIEEEISALLSRLRESNGDSAEALGFTIAYHMTSANLINRYRLTKGELAQVIKMIEDKVTRARVSPGEMVGCTAAQSIGEPCTQMTLNTFHLAGVGSANVTVGIPRFKELIDLSKIMKTPSMLVALNEEALQTTDANTCANLLLATRLDDHLSSYRIEDAQLLYDSELWSRHNLLVESAQIPFVFHMFFNIAKGVRSDTPPWKVALSLEKVCPGGIACVWSDVNDDIWEIYMYVLDIELVHATFPVQESLLEWNSHSPEHVKAWCEELFQSIIHEHIISGMACISEACVENASVTRMDPVTNAINTTDIPVLRTIGSSLYDVQNYAFVDWYRTLSNNILEIQSVLGIEAAVKSLADEMRSIISYDSTYVDDRHIMMIVNTMTYKGHLMPLSRHGINRTGNGVLVRSSFEETGDVIKDAALFGERDDVQGVSQSIMLGQCANIGTGGFDLRVVKASQPVVKRNSRLVKTKAKVYTRKETTKKSVRLIDVRDDATGENCGNIECPFIQTENDKPTDYLDAVLSTDQANSSSYAFQPQVTTTERSLHYTPSSPKLMCIWK